MRTFLASLFTLVFLLVATPAASGVLVNDTPGSNVQFGWGSSTCGLRTAVGEPGLVEVNIFNKDGDLISTVEATVPEYSSAYGRVAKLSENCQHLLVTAPFSNRCGGVSSGAGFFYTWNGSAYGSEVLLCGTDTAGGHQLGRSGDLNEDGSIVVLGAYLHDAAYAFVRGTPWIARKLPIPDVVVGSDNAGFCVAASGDEVLVTSPTKYNLVQGQDSIGEANIFKKDFGGVNNFGNSISRNLAGSGKFGYGCDLSGADFALSDPYYGDATSGTGFGDGVGIVYIYHHAGFASWGEDIIYSPTTSADEFGFSVSLSWGNMEIGAPYADLGGAGFVDTGRSYGYSRMTGGWEWEYSRIPSSPVTLDRHGWSVGVCGGIGVDSTPFSDDTFTDEGDAFTMTHGVVFTDGFETGDKLHWSSTVP